MANNIQQKRVLAFKGYHYRVALAVDHKRRSRRDKVIIFAVNSISTRLSISLAWKISNSNKPQIQIIIRVYEGEAGKLHDQL